MSRAQPSRARAAALVLPWLGLACSCSRDPEPAGEVLDLLARAPDAIFELPAAIVPLGDVPGTTTWGDSEGPGWSQTDLRMEDGTPYRATNQARASLILPASRPAERELVMGLWCPRPIGAEPAPVSVKLNGVELAGEGLVVGRQPAFVRLRAPKPAWRLGPNTLEFAVPEVERDGRPAWDSLALVSIQYGDEALVQLDPKARTVRFVDGTGARYVLALAEPAMLSVEGLITGASRSGELRFRTGTLDPQTGALEMDGDEGAIAAEAGGIDDEIWLTAVQGGLRVVELDWFAPEGDMLTLRRLDAQEVASPPRPPVVFISIDTFSARHLALYGYSRATCPELEEFQKDAVLFERCLANAPWTLPSYLSVMSGLYPRATRSRSPFRTTPT